MSTTIGKVTLFTLLLTLVLAPLALAQGGTILTTGDQFTLVLSGTLNTSAQGGLTLGCRVKQVRRLSRHEYHVGAWFIDPTPGQKDGLVALVDATRQVR